MKVTKAFNPLRRRSQAVESVGVPRIAKLMALAINLELLIKQGVVADQSEIARLGHVTRARVTQILDLNNLAPAVQEALLSNPPVGITERQLRPVVALADWKGQLRLWKKLQGETTARPADA